MQHVLKKREIIFGPYLWLDVSMYFDYNNITCQLSDIPINIEINSLSYTLVGCIRHKPGGIGHYIAYCRDFETGIWFQNDDLLPQKPINVPLTTHIKISAIFYIIQEK